MNREQLLNIGLLLTFVTELNRMVIYIKEYDMDKAMNHFSDVKTIPAPQHKGKPKYDFSKWMEKIEQSATKGIKVSEDFININSTLVALKAYFKAENINDMTVATRKIDGKLFLFVQKRFKK